MRKGGREGWRVKKGERGSERGMGRREGGSEGRRGKEGRREGGWEPERSRVTSYYIIFVSTC